MAGRLDQLRPDFGLLGCVVSPDPCPDKGCSGQELVEPALVPELNFNLILNDRPYVCQCLYR